MGYAGPIGCPYRVSLWGVGSLWGAPQLTLLSLLGVTASVIQDPNRDPEARMVMGGLMPVRRPQPGWGGGEE